MNCSRCEALRRFMMRSAFADHPELSNPGSVTFTDQVIRDSGRPYVGVGPHL
jgi:hypothetical protein